MAARKKITQDAMQDSFKGLFAGMTPKDQKTPEVPTIPANKPIKVRMTDKVPEDIPANKPIKFKKIDKAPEEPTKKKEPEKPAAEDKKPKGKGLTIWISEDEIERLQLYSKITGQKKGDVISAALDAFIKKHPATDEQKKAYQADQKKKQNLAKDI